MFGILGKVLLKLSVGSVVFSIWDSKGAKECDSCRSRKNDAKQDNSKCINFEIGRVRKCAGS